MTLQPVAAVLFRALLSGGRSPASVSSAEYHHLRSWLNESQERAVQKVFEASRGSAARLQRAIETYRRKPNVRLWSLLLHKPPEFRQAHGDTAEIVNQKRAAYLAAALDRMPAILDLQTPPVGTLHSRRKANGERRPIIAYDWTQQSRFRLLASALRPLVGFHPSQFLFAQEDEPRGTLAACKALLDALGSIAANADHYAFVELDIRDCFGSISTAWWEEKPRLHPDVMTQAYTSHHKVVISRRERDRVSDAIELWVRRGFPQGSALSALLAEWVIADVLRSVPPLPEGVFLFIYCDNIGILAPIKLIAAVKELIRDAFEHSRAGPFSLRDKTPIAAVNVPFRFLGMEFVVEDEAALIRPPLVRRELFDVTLLSDLGLAGSDDDFEKLRRKVLSRRSVWGPWPEVGAWADAHLTTISTTKSEAQLAAPVSVSAALG